MKKMKYFLSVASSLTGVSKERIKIIDFETDEDGLMHGTIEIDGNREYIHEYHI